MTNLHNYNFFSPSRQDFKFSGSLKNSGGRGGAGAEWPRRHGARRRARFKRALTAERSPACCGRRPQPSRPAAHVLDGVCGRHGRGAALKARPRQALAPAKRRPKHAPPRPPLIYPHIANKTTPVLFTYCQRTNFSI